jgi:hypothetical protein
MRGSEFLEVVARFGECDKGLHHCEMGTIRRIVEESIDYGKSWAAKNYVRFVDRVPNETDPDVRNANDESFLEDLALGEFIQAGYEAVRAGMPTHLRKILTGIDEK